MQATILSVEKLCGWLFLKLKGVLLASFRLVIRSWGYQRDQFCFVL